MILANLTNILMLVHGGQFTRGVLITPTNIVSSIMITRLMLNLRDPRLSGSGPYSVATLTPVAFCSRQAFSTLQDLASDVETAVVEATHNK